MKKIYNFLLGSALVFCTGCSADLLDIDNPNEVTILHSGIRQLMQKRV